MCASERSCLILTGTPNADGWQLVRRYQAVVGGSHDANHWFCAECFHDWPEQSSIARAELERLRTQVCDAKERA